MPWFIRVPAHITGFFKPIITNQIETTGSIGAGFSIKKYVYTYAEIDDESEAIRVFFNKREATKVACTTINVAKELLSRGNIEGLGVKIYHEFEIPIGCGLASSGAGALGAAFALNKVLNMGLPKNELVMIAHKAEINCKTGLGSVMGQYDGMFEIRLKAGGPGYGKVARFPMREKVAVVIYGPIETRNVISSKKVIKNIIRAFGNKHIELFNDFSLDRFIELSRRFVYDAKLVVNRVDYLLKKAKSIRLNGSMLNIGEGVFLFGEDLENKVNLMLQETPISLRPSTIILTEIDNEGVTEVRRGGGEN